MELYEAYDTEGDGICQYKSSKKFYFAGIKEYCRVQDGGAYTGCRRRISRRSS